MLNLLLDMTLAGSAVAVLWLLCRRLSGDRLPARWHYRILKAALFFLLVPVGRLAALLPKLPQNPPVPAAPLLPEAGVPVTVLPPVITPAPLPEIEPAAAPVSLSVDLLRLLAVLWAAGAAAILLYKVYLYIQLRRKLLSRNRGISSPETLRVFRECKAALNIKMPVSLRENPLVQTPLAVGLLWPVVVIPTGELTETELRCLFLHELTHIKAGDLWVRLGALSASALHWFNPLAHILRRGIQEFSEQSCDEAVTLAMTRQERRDYGCVILKFAASESAGAADYITSFAAKETIERRLLRVLYSKKLNGRKRLLALALAASILLCGTVAALAAQSPLLSANKPAGSGDPDLLENAPLPSAGDPDLPENAPLPSALDAPSLLPAGDAEGTPQDPIETAETIQDKIRAAWAGSGATSATAVVYGNKDLIVSRGGTLLPDDDMESYALMNDVLYKMYRSKDGTLRYEYLIGNEKTLPAGVTPDMLVDGVYPVNRLGETYGSMALGDYVGYAPDLCMVLNDRGEAGYCYSPDEQALPHNLPAEECPHQFRVPMYDKEHQVIGSYSISCGGHVNGGESAASIEDIKEQIGSGEDGIFYQAAPTDAAGTETIIVSGKIEPGDAPLEGGIPGGNPFVTGEWVNYLDTVVKGDADLIVSRGGTILPDGEMGSYSMVGTVLYKMYRDKNGITRPEYEIGNRAAVSEGLLPLLDSLENGVYPTNSNGESYGIDFISNYVGYSPDLIASTGADGSTGYYRQSEYNAIRAAFAAANDAGKFQVPLYASDGVTVVGEFPVVYYTH